MKIAQIPDIDLTRTFKYICNLCGYPEVSQDKSGVLIKFLKDNHGYNTDAELIDAYTALAAGRLEEKQDSFKSLTGMSASRVLQAYMRAKKVNAKVDDMPQGMSLASDDTVDLVKNYSGRLIRYNQDINQDEHRMLMDHWMGVQRENFRKHNRIDLLTSTGYDHLENNGTLRVKDGSFQMWDGKTYIDLCPWQQVVEIGERTKKHEDYMLNKNRQVEFRKMESMSAGDPLEKVVKRVALSIYFEHIT